MVIRGYYKMMSAHCRNRLIALAFAYVQEELLQTCVCQG